MTRRQMIVGGVIVGVLGVAVVTLWCVQRRAEGKGVAPAWLDPHQPAPDVASELTVLNADQSWAANRARPMAACCAGRTAGMRVRRTYDGNLADSPYSFIRASLAIGV
jgi:hypothetical protein